MADEEQLAILRQGVKVWNAWRKEHRNTRVDLRGVNLQRTDLQGVNLQRADLQRADLRDANLRDANLQGGFLLDAILSGAKLQKAFLSGAKLQKAFLSGARLQKAFLSGADLSGAILHGADLSGAILHGAILHGADLLRANLHEAILQRANLHGAILQRANLHGADLTEADMTYARVGATNFDDLDLRTVLGLDTMNHYGPSTIGIDTLYRSQGQIPEVFLRGCGVPDSMIEYAHSLVAAQRPIDYYSVFISYSSADEAIAQRLHADLQSKGVRCWFAPHDLEIGAPILRGIDEAIRIYDKLLIILSEAAVTSRWVDFEVSTALHREVEQGRTMLFPIRLDDAVLHTPSGWAAQLRSRHIGDFRGWKDYDAYQVAFTRLLRDLKAKA